MINVFTSTDVSDPPLTVSPLSTTRKLKLVCTDCSTSTGVNSSSPVTMSADGMRSPIFTDSWL